MKTEKKRTLKGSVLFTVVSVLALMIVFMTSALALASAANKRARKSYASSQTTYTARAAIDSILAAVGTDGNFATAVSNLSAGGTLNVEVGINDARLGRIESATISHAGTKAVFDPVSKKWIEKNILKITAEVTLGGETSTVTSHIIQDPVTKNEDGPGFLTMGGADVDNHSTVFGGSYVGMNWSDGGVGSNYQTYQYIEWNPVTEELVTLDDKLYRSDYNFHTQNEQSNEATMVVNGNYSVSNKIRFYYTKKGKGIEIWGDFNVADSVSKFEFQAEPQLQFANTTYKSFNEMPYLFVDGRLTSKAQNANIGDETFPLNLFCGSFEFNDGSPKLYCDVYAFDSDKTSSIQNNGSNLYNWAGSIGDGSEGYDCMGGSIYSKGALILGGNGTKVIKGEVRVEGNCHITGDVHIEGDLVVGGTLTVDNGRKLEVDGNVFARALAGDTHVKAAVSSEFKDGVTQETGTAVLVHKVKYYHNSNSDELRNEEWAWVKDSFLSDVGGEMKTEGGVTYCECDFAPDAIVNKKELCGNDTEAEMLNGYLIKRNANKSEPAPTYTVFKLNGAEIDEKDAYKELTFDKEIFPKYAEKEIILGLRGPIKGTEGHFMKDNQIVADMNNKTYTNGSIVGTITESGTITGIINKEVKIDATNNDVYILLKDVDFRNEDNPTIPQITVTEGNNHKVYFAFAGSVDTNYLNQAELDSTKIIDTVQEVMNTWGIEQNIKTPGDLDLSTPEGMAAYNQLKADAVEPENNVLDFTDARMTADGKNGFGIIKGSIDKKVIKIIPSNQSCWVILDKVSLVNGSKIIIDDTAGTGIVNFFIDTSLHFAGGEQLGYWGGAGICTQKFWNFANGTDIRQLRSDLTDTSLITTYKRAGKTPPTGKTENDPIPDLEPINVNFYSSKYIPSVLSGDNEMFITGFIRAPYLDVDEMRVPGRAMYKKFKDRMWYDGINLNDPMSLYGDWCIAVVGCLNVKSMKCGQPWMLLYQKPSDGSAPVTDANGEHLYAAVDYLDY